MRMGIVREKRGERRGNRGVGRKVGAGEKEQEGGKSRCGDRREENLESLGRLVPPPLICPQFR